jgi:hypothetical protein
VRKGERLRSIDVLCAVGGGEVSSRCASALGGRSVGRLVMLRRRMLLLLLLLLCVVDMVRGRRVRSGIVMGKLAAAEDRIHPAASELRLVGIARHPAGWHIDRQLVLLLLRVMAVMILIQRVPRRVKRRLSVSSGRLRGGGDLQGHVLLALLCFLLEVRLDHVELDVLPASSVLERGELDPIPKVARELISSEDGHRVSGHALETGATRELTFAACALLRTRSICLLRCASSSSSSFSFCGAVEECA